MIYYKLYTKKLELSTIIPWEGLSSSLETNNYILLEKNYLPVNSTIEKSIIKQTGEWLNNNSIILETHDNYYNKLIFNNISENTTNEPNTAVIEFKATNLENNIEPCNTLLLYVKQSPHEIISAHIDFVPYDAQEIVNDKLNINGDEQYIHFFYYGINNDTKIISDKQVNIKINGENLKQSKIVAKNFTSNGIEIIYKIDPYNNAEDLFVNYVVDSSDEWSDWINLRNINNQTVNFGSCYLPSDKNVGDYFKSSIIIEWDNVQASGDGQFRILALCPVDGNYSTPGFFNSQLLQLKTAPTNGVYTYKYTYLISESNRNANLMRPAFRIDYATGRFRYKSMIIEKGPVEFELTCTYTTEYNNQASETKYVIQQPNQYEIVISEITNTSSDYRFPADINDYITIKYYGLRNNRYLKNNVILSFLPVTNIPYLNFTKLSTIFNSTTNLFETIIKVDKNFTLNELQAKLVAKYENYSSEKIIITQEAANRNDIQLHIIPIDPDISYDELTEPDNITINPTERILKLKYYATYNDIQFINAPVIINNSKQNQYINLLEVSDKFEIISDEIIENNNQPYKLLTIKIPQNTTMDEISGNIIVNLFTNSNIITKTFTITLSGCNLYIDILAPNSTNMIGGLLDECNTIHIKMRYMMNGQPIIDPKRISVSITENRNHINDLKKSISLESNYIIFNFPVKTIYEDDRENNFINIKFLFKLDGQVINENYSTWITQRYPIVYDCDIECKDIEKLLGGTYDYDINGSGANVILYYHGIKYNYIYDHVNYIYDLNLDKNNLILSAVTPSINVNDYLTFSDRTPSKTTTDVRTEVLFKLNNMGNDIMLNITLTNYHNKTKVLKFKLNTALLNLLFYISNVSYNDLYLYNHQLELEPYTTLLYLNTFNLYKLTYCAELQSPNGSILTLETPGTITYEQTVDSSNGKFKINSFSNSIVNGKDIYNCSIGPHFNVGFTDNKPEILFTYNLTYNNIEFSKNIKLLKKNLEGDFFVSLDSKNVVLEQSLNASGQLISLYFKYTYINDDGTFIDETRNHYIVKKDERSTLDLELEEDNYEHKKYDPTEDSSTDDEPIGPIGPVNPHPFGANNIIIPDSGNLPEILPIEKLGNSICTYNRAINMFKYIINIPPNQTTEEKRLILTVNYTNPVTNEDLAYYNVRKMSDELLFTLEAGTYDLTYSFAYNVTPDLIKPNSNIYYLNTTDTGTELYITGLLNGKNLQGLEPLVRKNNSLTTGNCICSLVEYEIKGEFYIYNISAQLGASTVDRTNVYDIYWRYDQTTPVIHKLFTLILKKADSLNLILTSQNAMIDFDVENVNIIYYLLINNKTRFNPYTAFVNNAHLILSGDLIDFNTSPNTVTHIDFPEIRTPDSLKQFYTTYNFGKNLGSEKKILILTCNYINNKFPLDNLETSFRILQNPANNVILCLDIIKSSGDLDKGDACVIYVEIYYIIGGITYELPDDVVLRQDSPEWVHIDGLPMMDGKKKKYKYLIDENIDTIESFHPYPYLPYRTCTFSYTFNNYTISKEITQYTKWTECNIDFSIE